MVRRILKCTLVWLPPGGRFCVHKHSFVMLMYTVYVFDGWVLQRTLMLVRRRLAAVCCALFARGTYLTGARVIYASLDASIAVRSGQCVRITTRYAYTRGN